MMTALPQALELSEDEAENAGASGKPLATKGDEAAELN